MGGRARSVVEPESHVRAVVRAVGRGAVPAVGEHYARLPVRAPHVRKGFVASVGVGTLAAVAQALPADHPVHEGAVGYGGGGVVAHDHAQVEGHGRRAAPEPVGPVEVIHLQGGRHHVQLARGGIAAVQGGGPVHGPVGGHVASGESRLQVGGRDGVPEVLGSEHAVHVAVLRTGEHHGVQAHVHQIVTVHDEVRVRRRGAGEHHQRESQEGPAHG